MASRHVWSPPPLPNSGSSDVTRRIVEFFDTSIGWPLHVLVALATQSLMGMVT
ncbi:MAG TPA: hypothetical protein VJQ83_08070 [Tepidiformaceae bacterium]|nr:hypothetical protein [Tepidiformaceae bacterium]